MIWLLAMWLLLAGAATVRWMYRRVRPLPVVALVSLVASLLVTSGLFVLAAAVWSRFTGVGP